MPPAHIESKVVVVEGVAAAVDDGKPVVVVDKLVELVLVVGNNYRVGVVGQKKFGCKTPGRRLRLAHCDECYCDDFVDKIVQDSYFSLLSIYDWMMMILALRRPI